MDFFKPKPERGCPHPQQLRQTRRHEIVRVRAGLVTRYGWDSRAPGIVAARLRQKIEADKAAGRARLKHQ